MKFSIYNDPAAPTEPEIALRLTRPTNGNRDRILVAAVNPVTGETLNCGNLMSIYPDGTYQRCFAARFNGKDFRSKR